MKISIEPQSSVDAELCKVIAAQLGLPISLQDADLILHISNRDGPGLSCPGLDPKAQLKISFSSGSVHHRRQFGGGKSQLIAKAVGIKSGVKPSILDVTAGLGRDAFVFASLGSKVTAVERSTVLLYMLNEAKTRASEQTLNIDEDLAEILGRLTIIGGEALDLLSSENSLPAEVVYLDPMFSERKKTAAVKKEMQILHELLDQDCCNESSLLERALDHASHRVVVKRSRHAPSIDGPKPKYALRGKSTRFDIYPLKALS